MTWILYVLLYLCIGGLTVELLVRYSREPLKEDDVLILGLVFTLWGLAPLIGVALFMREPEFRDSIAKRLNKYAKDNDPYVKKVIL